MQTLLATETPTVTLSPPAYTAPNPKLDSTDPHWLGERLREAYGPVEANLPARLAELVERLAQNEQSKD